MLAVTERRAAHPPPAHAPFRRILCPVDFSEASRAALRYALSLAQEANARLMLLHVLEPAALASGSDYPSPDPGELAQTLWARLRAEVPDEARDWCEVTERVARGRPGRRSPRSPAGSRRT